MKYLGMVPKGRAMALHLSPEYQEGVKAHSDGLPNSKNPYDFWQQYDEHYAWDIGWQHDKNDGK